MSCSRCHGSNSHATHQECITGACPSRTDGVRDNILYHTRTRWDLAAASIYVSRWTLKTMSRVCATTPHIFNCRRLTHASSRASHRDTCCTRHNETPRRAVEPRSKLTGGIGGLTMLIGICGGEHPTLPLAITVVDLDADEPAILQASARARRRWPSIWSSTMASSISISRKPTQQSLRPATKSRARPRHRQRPSTAP